MERTDKWKRTRCELRLHVYCMCRQASFRWKGCHSCWNEFQLWSQTLNVIHIIGLGTHTHINTSRITLFLSRQVKICILLPRWIVIWFGASMADSYEKSCLRHGQQQINKLGTKPTSQTMRVFVHTCRQEKYSSSSRWLTKSNWLLAASLSHTDTGEYSFCVTSVFQME